ncbi:hypothetical protein [Microbacterium azadirachtae]|uniref:Uncharacterized protein n=1 Tax=Microbacterium azadirachtae TaxID=582680 RepID=A0A0F0LEP4_9MICO|nr:hypothetical protein [Microbacterium azadirachtae]KJL31164.1 hypothetical protein RS86_03280 [Microbacterium azadirachtae]
MSELEQPKGVSRRTVTKAMAWAVPAVALAAPIPAFAVSGPPPQINAGAACKSPGNSCSTFPKGYNVPATVHNPDPTKTIWITAITITNNTTGIALSPASSPALPIQINPGATINVVFQAKSSNSANVTGSFDFNITWGHAANGSDHDHSPIPVHIVINGTPPGCVCP